MREPEAERASDGAPGTVVHLLAAVDPANPYGAALAWPSRDGAARRPLPRAAGAYVVLVDGAPVLYLERGGHSLQTLPAAGDAAAAGPAFAALRALVDGGRLRELVISRINGDVVAGSPWLSILEASGFVAGYRGYVLRPAVRRVIAAARGLAPETAVSDEYWRRGDLAGRATRRTGPRHR